LRRGPAGPAVQFPLAGAKSRVRTNCWRALSQSGKCPRNILTARKARASGLIVSALLLTAIFVAGARLRAACRGWRGFRWARTGVASMREPQSPVCCGAISDEGRIARAASFVDGTRAKSRKCRERGRGGRRRNKLCSNSVRKSSP
jgi:hypothetical protein